MSDCFRMLRRMYKEESDKYGKADPVQGIFITIDPKRDTPEKAHEYAVGYNKNFVGLGGSFDQIDHCTKQFRIYYAQGPTGEDPDEYLVDHTIAIYLMDPNGEFVAYYLKKKSAV